MGKKVREFLLFWIFLSLVEPLNGVAQERTSRIHEKLNFILVTMDDREVTLADYRGKVVLVNFWATWCGPCVHETPALVRLYNKYQKRGFVIIGVARQSEESKVNEFIERFSIPYPVGRDTTGEIGNRYQIFSIPTSILFSPEGKVQRKFQGFGEGVEELIDQELQMLLEPVPARQKNQRTEAVFLDKAERKVQPQAKQRSAAVNPASPPPLKFESSVNARPKEDDAIPLRSLTKPAPLQSETYLDEHTSTSEEKEEEFPSSESSVATPVSPSTETSPAQIVALVKPVPQPTKSTDGEAHEQEKPKATSPVSEPSHSQPLPQTIPSVEAPTGEALSSIPAFSYARWNFFVPLLTGIGLFILTRMRLGAPSPNNLGFTLSPSTFVESVPYARLMCSRAFPHLPSEVAVVHDNLLIGSGTSCDIILPHPSVARQHARLQWRRQGYVLIDLQSPTGTYVNGRRITENLLREGWIIRIGEVEFVFREASTRP